MPKGKPRSDWDPARGRNGSAWRRIREALIFDGAVCAYWDCDCPWGREIDTSVHPRSRWAGTVDHIVALTDGGHPTDASNLMVCHLRCNDRKEAERRRAVKAATQAASSRKRRSRDW